MPWGLGNAAVLLLPLALLGYWLLGRRRGLPGALAGLQALVLWGWTLWALSEGLGALEQLKPLPLGLAWAAVLLAQGLVWLHWPKVPAEPATKAPLPGPARTLLAALSAMALLSFWNALLTPAVNFDSQLYHLVRVQQWAQQASLAHFPTSYDLQDFYPPWAETVLLNFRLLSGDDLLAGLLQWAAWLACGLAVWQIASTADKGWAARWGSVAAMAALPMGVLQSLTTQNDLVAAAWVAAMGALLLVGAPLWAAGAAGLALATKGSAYLFIAPLGVWLILDQLQALGLRAWRPLLLAALLAFTPSLPHWARNFHATGTLLASAQDHQLPVPGFRPFASNLIKEAGLQLSTPLYGVEVSVTHAVARVHQALGLPLDWPDWIWAGIPWGFYLDPLRGWHEDYSGAPLHLFALVLLGLLAAAGVWRSPLPWGYGLSALAGLGLYVGLLRYNPWAARLQLPFFVLSAPLLGLAWSRLRPVPAALLAVAFLSLGYWALLDDHRHPFGNARPGFAAQYWAAEPSYRAGYNAGLNGTRIGLLIPERSLEYGVWRGALAANPRAQLQHLSPSASTARLSLEPPFAGFVPDLILADVQKALPLHFERDGRSWTLAAHNPLWGIYTPRPLQGAPR